VNALAFNDLESKKSMLLNWKLGYRHHLLMLNRNRNIDKIKRKPDMDLSFSFKKREVNIAAIHYR